MEIKLHYSTSAGNLYQVDDILIEAGVPIRKIKEALNFKLSHIEGCLISHSHGDHAKAAKDLLKFGVDAYMSEKTAQELSVSGHRLHIVHDQDLFTVGKWRVLPFKLKHDVENYGFLMSRDDEKVMYAIDTNYIKYKFKGLTRVILGVNYDYKKTMESVQSGRIDPVVVKRSLKNHMSIETAEGFFRANDLSKLRASYIVHLSNMNSDEKDFKERIQAITGKPVYIE